MLDSLKLQLVWLVIEHRKTSITQELSDYEITQNIIENLQEQIFLSNSELIEVYIYIRSRIPLIRDLAEIQVVMGE